MNSTSSGVDVAGGVDASKLRAMARRNSSSSASSGVGVAAAAAEVAAEVTAVSVGARRLYGMQK